MTSGAQDPLCTQLVDCTITNFYKFLNSICSYKSTLEQFDITLNSVVNPRDCLMLFTDHCESVRLFQSILLIPQHIKVVIIIDLGQRQKSA